MSDDLAAAPQIVYKGNSPRMSDDLAAAPRVIHKGGNYDLGMGSRGSNGGFPTVVSKKPAIFSQFQAAPGHDDLGIPGDTSTRPILSGKGDFNMPEGPDVSIISNGRRSSQVETVELK